jgi:hypothetical protein
MWQTRNSGKLATLHGKLMLLTHVCQIGEFMQMERPEFTFLRCNILKWSHERTGFDHHNPALPNTILLSLKHCRDSDFVYYNPFLVHIPIWKNTANWRVRNEVLEIDDTNLICTIQVLLLLPAFSGLPESHRAVNCILRITRKS